MLVVVSARGTPAKAPPGELGGTSWRIVNFEGGDGKMITPSDKSKYTISFGAAGDVSVRIDCNRGRGTWKSSGANQLEFGPLALTRAMCPPAPLNNRLPNDWQNIRSYVLKNGHLFLSLMADGGIYELEPLESNVSGSNSAALEDTYWKLIRLRDTPVTAASEQQEPHIVLNRTSHRVSGSGGCNRIMGSYELSGDRITFSQIAGTMMACANGMDTEQAFLKALSQVKTWKIAAQRLELYNAAGQLVASLERRQMK